MFKILKKNLILIIVLTIVIAFFAWFALSDKSPDSSLLSTENSLGTATAAEQELLRLLIDMRSIRLNSAIFENTAFQALQDFGREIVAEPVGRTNPFAPIGTDVGIISSEVTR